MQTVISDFTQQLIHGKKSHSNGWISFNAVCCHHRGERPDSRHRGGVHPNPDGSITYSCFNCKFKASYRPGLDLGFKFRTLLRWMGASENDILRMSLEAMRLKDLIGPPDEKASESKKEFNFEPRSLPPDSLTFEQALLKEDSPIPEQRVADAVGYLVDRGINPASRDYYLSAYRGNGMNRRIILPCTWKRQLVGYTARALTDDVKPKYWDAIAPGYVFNIDEQSWDREFVLAMEGPFDALALSGVSFMGSDITDEQAELIDSLGKDVILVPHADKAGVHTVNRAVDLGWAVSFPVWLETCKDANEAVVKYGKLFALKAVLDAVEYSKIKIKLKTRMLLR